MGNNHLERFIKSIENQTITLDSANACWCGSREHQVICSKDRFGLDFQMKLCANCGLLYTSPRISQASLETYYKEYYHDITFVDRDPKEFLVRENQSEVIFEFIEEFFQSQTKINILDIGCSNGAIISDISKELSKRKIESELHGLEYSQAYIDEAVGKGISVIQGGIEAIGKFEKKFDLIIMSHVFEHLIDLDVALNDLKGYLNEDGYIYIEVPGVKNLLTENRYSYDLNTYFIHCHNYHFELATLQQVIEKNDLYCIKGDEKVACLVSENPATSAPEMGYYNFLSYLKDCSIVAAEFADLKNKLIEKNDTIETINSDREEKKKRVEELNKGNLRLKLLSERLNKGNLRMKALIEELKKENLGKNNLIEELKTNHRTKNAFILELLDVIDTSTPEIEKLLGKPEYLKVLPKIEK
jgi:SAM-dependent methyltransferase